MAHVITQGCIECGRCMRVCPENAIYKGVRTSVINPGLCSDCGTCVDECPLELIVPEWELESDQDVAS